MPCGFNGKILRVNLTNRKIWTEEPEEILYRRYLGGGGLALYYMLSEMKPGLDPLGPDNLLIFMTSVTNGMALSGLNRYTAAGKSPLTGGYGEAEAGGWWGPELKAIVVRGHGRPAAADPEGAKRVQKWFQEHYDRASKGPVWSSVNSLSRHRETGTR